MEAHVLAHVGKIGSDKASLARPKLANRVRCEQKWQQLCIRTIEAAQEDDVTIGDIAYGPEIRFSVRELAVLQYARLCAERGTQGLEERLTAGKREDDRPAHSAAIPKIAPLLTAKAAA
ncbi:hypothetical protein Sbs19_43080 [Sphingobium sp. BS19]|nr:hypothetical protein Sbs19_43080 [Sphingobium sp. BS19]